MRSAAANLQSQTIQLYHHFQMPSICPNCGADVPARAKACPECGSDDQTGWSSEAETSGLDLPEENFNYEKFVETEFGARKNSPSGLPWFWWIAAVAVIAALVWLMLA